MYMNTRTRRCCLLVLACYLVASSSVAGSASKEFFDLLLEDDMHNRVDADGRADLKEATAVVVRSGFHDRIFEIAWEREQERRRSVLTARRERLLGEAREVRREEVREKMLEGVRTRLEDRTVTEGFIRLREVKAFEGVEWIVTRPWEKKGMPGTWVAFFAGWTPDMRRGISGEVYFGCDEVVVREMGGANVELSHDDSLPCGRSHTSWRDDRDEFNKRIRYTALETGDPDLKTAIDLFVESRFMHRFIGLWLSTQPKFDPTGAVAPVMPEMSAEQIAAKVEEIAYEHLDKTRGGRAHNPTEMTPYLSLKQCEPSTRNPEEWWVVYQHSRCEDPSRVCTHTGGGLSVNVVTWDPRP